MFETIVKNMSDARDSGDLYQGSVTEEPVERAELRTKSEDAPQVLPEQQNKQFSAEDLLSGENDLVLTPEIEDPSFSNSLP